MKRDPELDELKAVQEAASMRQQRASGRLEAALERQDEAAKQLGRARKARETARGTKGSAKRRHELMRRSVDRRIAVLKSLAKGASPKAAQEYAEECQQLTERVEAARVEYHKAKEETEAAEAKFVAAERECELAEQNYQHWQDELQRTRAEFIEATGAFEARLERLRGESEDRREDRSIIAARASVPEEFRDNVDVYVREDGAFRIRFGGKIKPFGLGHGQYVLDGLDVIFRRNPVDPLHAIRRPIPIYWRGSRMDFDKASGKFLTRNNCYIRGDDDRKIEVRIAVYPDGRIASITTANDQALYDLEREIGRIPTYLAWSR